MSEKIENLEEKIESWKVIHSKLFPYANSKSQLLKLNEELGELDVACNDTEYAEEFGDVLVVAISLLRFPRSENIGKFIIYKELYRQSSKKIEKRLNLIEKSFLKCKQRVSEKRYKFVNGIYVRNKNEKSA